MVTSRGWWIRTLCLVVVASSVQAQSPRLSPRNIGAIINAALREIIPPETRLGNGTVAERGIRFDYSRTMTAFGLPDDHDMRASLGLDRVVTEGSLALFADCDQLGMQPCARIGHSVWVAVEPISVSDSEVVVWVHVSYATTMPSNRRYLSGFATEVFLARSGSGPWRFVRTGRGIVS